LDGKERLMRNYEMVLLALKSGKTWTMADLKAELPGLEWWNMHKYVARAKYLAGAEIELMKAGAVIKTARAKEAETLRLVNVDKFKSWKPETKTGGPLFRKANPKAKATRKAVVKAAKPVKAAVKPKAPVKDLHAASNARIAKVVAENPGMVPEVVVTPTAPVVEAKPSVVDMIRAELAATAPKGVAKKAAALPRGPVKMKRVSDEVTPPKDPEDLLEIPDFLRIQTDKSPKLAEE
jgi:hypothetical protein